MMNKKLIALFVAIATVSAVSAGWYDEAGVYHHGIRPGYDVGDVVEDTGYAAERTVGGAAAATTAVVGGIFGGRERREERRNERETRREQRRAEREARNRE